MCILTKTSLEYGIVDLNDSIILGGFKIIDNNAFWNRDARIQSKKALILNLDITNVEVNKNRYYWYNNYTGLKI